MSAVATRAPRNAALVSAAGALALVLGACLDPARAAAAYLAAWLFWLTLALGALFLVMIHHLTGSTWFIALRRLAEQSFSALPLLALLALPLVPALPLLYPWMHPATLDPHTRALVGAKAAYLNGPFFSARAVLYLAVWLGAAALLARWSAAQDRGEGVRLALRQKRFCAAALPAVALAFTFACFDWVMSLAPAWSSSVFGVYVFAGSAVGALSLLVVASVLAQRRGHLRGVVTISHYHGMGKLLFTFVVFWAYIGFFQFFIIWIANVPEEAAWYAARWRDGWAPVSATLALGHFALPFFLLLSRERKRRPARLAAVALWLLAMHYLDLYWLVLPSGPEPGFHPHWLDAAALAAVGGGSAAFALWRAGRGREAARGDPRFEHSLRFSTR